MSATDAGAFDSQFEPTTISDPLAGRPAPLRRLAVIGCGLIGGSFALAARRAGLAPHVVGYSKSARDLDDALKLGVIDEAAASPAAAAAGAELVLIAVPLSAVETALRGVQPGLAPDAWLMDVGSTKRDVVDAARRVLRDDAARFIPAHPIAGGERAGSAFAQAQLFDGRHVVLTPLPSTDPQRLERAADIWRALGAQVSSMTPENHDAAFAAVSHLPHMLAFAYMASLIRQPAGAEYLGMAGPGFRDFTRIAASDPEIWRDILLANREEVLKQSQRFRHALDALERALLAPDRQAVTDLVRAASEARGHWHIGSFAPARAMSGAAASPPPSQPTSPAPAPGRASPALPDAEP